MAMQENNWNGHALSVKAMLRETEGKTFQESRWGMTHCDAFTNPRPGTFEPSIVGLIEAVAAYADQHFSRYESKIGDDGVLGPHWEAIVRGIRGLRDGEIGRLDCGTIDELLCGMLSAEGFSTDI